MQLFYYVKVHNIRIIKNVSIAQRMNTSMFKLNNAKYVMELSTLKLKFAQKKHTYTLI